MRRSFLLLASATAVGCSTTSPKPPSASMPASVVVAKPTADGAIVPASFAEPAGDTTPPAPAGGSFDLAQLTALTLERHPRLAQVGWVVEAARGRAQQAGLYPNPTVAITADELGDRTGPLGIIGAPAISQEIVRGNKLGLAQAAAFKEVDRAALAVVDERYKLLTGMRQSYWDAVVLQRRAVVLNELIALADRSVETAEKLLKAKEGSELDVVQLEVDRERYRAELEATKRALPAALRKLAADAGAADYPITAVIGDVEANLPNYDLATALPYILGVHPQVQSARVLVEQNQLTLRRAEAEPTPNVTVSGGYVRQNQNRSNDVSLGISMPIPLWNRNQGNVYAARAQVSEALNEIARVQNDLAARTAAAFELYEAAKARADKYRTAIIPKAEKSLALAQKAYQGGQFDFLRVLQAQRAVAEARLEFIRSLGEVRKAAADIAGLMLEDQEPMPIITEKKQP